MCVPAVVLNRTRIGVPPRPPKNASGPDCPPPPIGPAGPAPRPRPPQLELGVLRPPPCQLIKASSLPSSTTDRRSHGTEPNPVGDMLSPKIGVTVIVYSPSDGNVCGTSMPPR